ncbi:MAG: hypothetical protein K2Q18_06075 [Bdellovibrionales bacterium]|nr:hypothetical protein [Bdellovibrionales bacterium]
MAFLAQLAAIMLKWILTLGGKALYEWTTELVKKQEQVKKQKENKKKYDEALKKGDKDEILKAERDLINNR